MGRKKTTLAYIANHAARNATLRTRRRGLFKKVRELSVLCGVPVCAVVYTPQDAMPEVWPSPEEARVLLERFNGASGLSKNNKMMNPEMFLAKRMENLRAQLGRVMAENAQLQGDFLHRECLAGRSASGMNGSDLQLIGQTIARRKEAVQARLLQLTRNAGDRVLPLPPTLITLPPEEECHVQPDGETTVETVQRQHEKMASAGADNGEAVLPVPVSDLSDFWGYHSLGSEQEPFPASDSCSTPGLDLPDNGGGGGTWADILGSFDDILPPSDDFLLPKWDEYESFFGMF